MSTVQQTQGFNRAATERGVVNCDKCRTPNFVNKPASVRVEFSVPCPHCGHRGIYFKRMLTTETIPERRANRRD